MDLILVGPDCHIKTHCFWCLTSERIQNLKVVCKYICSVFDREVCELKYVSGSQSFSSY